MLAPSSTIRDLLAVLDQPGMRSLGGGFPAVETFPVERLRSAAEQVLSAGAVAAQALQYGPTDGIAELRSELARPSRLHGLRRGHADDIVITTGSQQGLDLIARAMLDPNDAVGVEDPCYLGARQVFIASGAKLRGIPIDEQGLSVDVLRDFLTNGWRPRLVYTVPNFQNPSGASLSVERRHALVELAAHYGFLIVEDDPYHALGFTATPPDAIGELDVEHVVTLGSLSKVLSPGFRIGWMRAPRWLRDAVIRAKQACDLHTASITQAIALEVVHDRAFMDAHLDRNAALYAARAAALCDAVRLWCEMPAPTGGMFLWGDLGVDTTALLERAIKHRVAFIPGSAFAVDRTWSSHARLSFATLAPCELHAAAASLRDAVDELKE